MEQYRYTLEKGAKKNLCPHCYKKKFVRYVDTLISEYLPEQYGRCDREIKCGYHLNPYINDYSSSVWKKEQDHGKVCKFNEPKQIKKVSKEDNLAPIPFEVLESLLTGYEKNVFIQTFLTRLEFPFKIQDIEKVISQYYLGTILETGACAFPFIDLNNNVRAIQEKIFDHANHTDKSKKYHTGWVHSRLTNTEFKNKQLPDWLKAYNQNDSKVSCLFGEHLLTKYPCNPIALVEAPKTAIYGTLYLGFPEDPANLVWLAVSNLSSLNLNKCRALKGRKVYLFPDLSKNGRAIKLWKNRAKEIQEQLQGSYFEVSDLLEQFASKKDIVEGKDLADFLENLDWANFRKMKNENLNVHQKPKFKQFELGNEELNIAKPDSIEIDFVSKLDYLKYEYLNRIGTHRENYSQKEWLDLDDGIFWSDLIKHLDKCNLTSLKLDIDRTSNN